MRGGHALEEFVELAIAYDFFFLFPSDILVSTTISMFRDLQVLRRTVTTSASLDGI